MQQLWATSLKMRLGLRIEPVGYKAQFMIGAETVDLLTEICIAAAFEEGPSKTGSGEAW
jgi:hypothetical protein